MLQPLDGPAAQLALSVTTGTVLEAKAGGTVLPERKSVIIQPLNGDIYLYFGDDTDTAPSTATIQSNGLVLIEGERSTFEASDSQHLYVLAINSTTNTIVVERA